MNKQRSKLPIMAHLVLGYPTLAESLRTAEQYIEAGVEILELQIPFSHPTADGPVITAACQEATLQGVTVRDCIEAIRDLHDRFPAQEIMVMSYLNRIYTFGFQEFATEMKIAGVKYLIIPDLPADSQAFTGLPLKLVPVLAANSPESRIEKLLSAGFDFFYLMSDFKITGSGFSLHPRLKAIVHKIKAHQSPIHPSPIHQSTNLPAIASLPALAHQGVTGGKSRQAGAKEGHPTPRIGIGFGISTPAQAKLVTEEADVAIIGSALIQAQKEGKLAEYLESLRQVFNTP